MKIKTVIFFLAIIIPGHSVLSQLRLPAVIADSMVLQRNAEATIWGWDDPGAEVKVRAGWTLDEFVSTAGENGEWSVSIPTTIAGGPYNIYISGSGDIVVKDILLGDVWICSGQSNMEYKINWMGGWSNPWFEHDSIDIERNKYPLIRLFQLKKNTSDTPLDDCQGQWMPVNTRTVAEFSAVAFFFGRELNRKLGVPVGLVQTAWGGTPAESWTSARELESNGDLSFYTQGDYSGEGEYRRPARLFNAMINPLLKMSITGAIWYQGEANSGDALHYRKLFPAMIKDWRKHFNQGDFPFYYVQIAPYKYDRPMVGALVREAQLMALEVPGTGMAVTSDIGNPDDIHPVRKQEVGRRLARHAMALHYGVKGLTYSGPVFENMEIEGHEGRKKVRLFFSHIARGLVYTGEKLRCFEIAGDDRIFYEAEASIEGNNVMLWSDMVKKPVAVRFGFSNAAEPNLFNSEGLPASPFRTDDWEVETEIIEQKE
ncbi:MAG: sialate O-acetylesterase [Bacteroidota bacterium]